MMEYFNCGRVMEKNGRTRPPPVDLSRLIHLFGDLPHATLVEQRMEWMNCQAITKTTVMNARVGLPSQSCARNGRCSPAASPKFGSSRDLKAIAIAADDISRGRKTARPGMPGSAAARR